MMSVELQQTMTGSEHGRVSLPYTLVPSPSELTATLESQQPSDSLATSPESLSPLDFHRFSESPIWQKQRAFFENAGAEAWRQGIVPHYVTSNPIMANAYVEMLVAFWQDNLANGSLNVNAPLYVLELGAGSGVFSHAILAQLIKRLEKSPLKKCKPVLIISDFVQANLDFAKQHPKLKTYIEKGCVDFALLDAERDESFQLQINKTHIAKGSLHNPLAAIANYVFDGLTQDLVCVHYGKVFDGYMAIQENQQDTALSETLVNEPVYDWRPLDQPAQYYDEELIEHYLRYLDSNPVLIPTGAIQSIELLKQYSRFPLLILSTDRGLSTFKQLRQQVEPGFASHGSFSLPVNYHALSWLTEKQGGLAMVCQRRDEGLAISALLYGKNTSESFHQSEQAFHCAVEQFNPDDAYNLKRAMESVGQHLSAEQMLAQLRLSRWDYRILDLFFESLLEHILYLQPDERMQWQEAIQETWHHYYPLGDKVEPSYQMGTLAIQLRLWGVGKNCFHACLDDHTHLNIDNEIKGLSYFNLALCCYQLGDINKAESYAQKAKALAKQVGEQQIQDEQHNLEKELQQSLSDNRDEHSLENNHNLSNFEGFGIGGGFSPPLPSPAEQCEELLRDIQQTKSMPNWYNKALFSEGEISLQPLAKHHAVEVFYQTRDPSIAVMTRLPEFDSLEAVEQWIEESSANKSIPKHNFAVIHKEFGFVGSVALHCAGEDAFFYFWVGVDYQGEGYGPKAAALLSRAAKRAMGIKQFFTTVYEDNYRSLRALQGADWQLLSFSTADVVSSSAADETIQCLTLGIHATTDNSLHLKKRFAALMHETDSVMTPTDKPVNGRKAEAAA